MKPEPPKDMWDRLSVAESAVGMGKIASIEPGWFSRADYEKQRGLTPSGARARLSLLVTKGVLETKTVIMGVGQSTQRLRIYRLKDSPCQTGK